MPSTDRRSTANHQSGGSDYDIEVKLTAEEAALYMEAGDGAGWYQKYSSQKGNLSTTNGPKVRKRENGKVLGTTGREDLVRKFTAYETDSKSLKLLRTLRREPHDYRYKLPFGDGYQVWGLRNALVTNDWGFDTAEDTDRTPEIEVTAMATSTVEAYEVEEVADVVDQSTWPDSLADFKDVVAV